MSELDEAELTAEEILTFGPVVEAQVWTPMWLQEAKAPIAQAAGRAKLRPVFDEQGIGKAVLIRPCMSRGRRVRGLSPVYTPTMLEANATVFTGWPMYLDHVPAELAETLAKKGRSVKELGGQVLTPFWQMDFTQEGDEGFGYQPGGVLAEVWATPYMRQLVGENPNLLHTSISAWPTAGKPGPVPWKAGAKGMVIEGIRRQPQGSVDFVPRGGAGGRLLPQAKKLAEGEDPDMTAWPEPSWTDEDRSLVVSLAERVYAPEQMTTPPDFSKMSPAELRTWVQENHTHLSPALAPLAESVTAPAAAPAAQVPALTADDVKAIIAESASDEKPLTEAEFEEKLDGVLAEREEQRTFSGIAAEMIRVAEGIPDSWKADLKARYAMRPEGAPPALLVESDNGGKDGAERSAEDVLRENVKADLEHARDLIAEAQGKPRVTGEGGATSANAGHERGKAPAVQRGRGQVQEGETPLWRQRFADMGIVESADDALAIHGVEKVEG